MKLIAFLSTFLLVVSVQGKQFTYNDIAKRNPTVALTKKQLKEAKMQGECLVGLKELNFKKKEVFDPVAEWTNFRSISLLKQLPPCQVLVIMEVAQKALKKQQKTIVAPQKKLTSN